MEMEHQSFILRDGDYFGDFELQEGKKRISKITCLSTTVQLFHLDIKSFNKYLRNELNNQITKYLIII